MSHPRVFLQFIKKNKTLSFQSKELHCSNILRTCLHGMRVPLGDRVTLPTRVEDTVVLHAKFEHGKGTLSVPSDVSRDSVIV